MITRGLVFTSLFFFILSLPASIFVAVFLFSAIHSELWLNFPAANGTEFFSFHSVRVFSIYRAMSRGFIGKANDIDEMFSSAVYNRHSGEENGWWKTRRTRERVGAKIGSCVERGIPLRSVFDIFAIFNFQLRLDKISFGSKCMTK